MFIFFFFNDTATTEIYTLSLHDALPISRRQARSTGSRTTKTSVLAEVETLAKSFERSLRASNRSARTVRSEEHTSELQSPCNLVCRLLLEKKKKYTPSRRT